MTLDKLFAADWHCLHKSRSCIHPWLTLKSSLDLADCLRDLSRRFRTASGEGLSGKVRFSGFVFVAPEMHSPKSGSSRMAAVKRSTSDLRGN